jgi:activating signal cointegrator complex subunit 2
LKQLNHLLHSSPDTAVFFSSGTDFLDGLVSCYKLMNPPLRKAILSTTYLCLIGLTEGQNPNFSLLSDQLYSLKAAAEAHKAGPTNENDSLVVSKFSCFQVTYIEPVVITEVTHLPIHLFHPFSSFPLLTGDVQAELVTATPILKQIELRMEASGTSLVRTKSLLPALGAFRKAGGGRPKNIIKRRIDKGKGKARDNDPNDEYGHGTR